MTSDAPDLSRGSTWQLESILADTEGYLREARTARSTEAKEFVEAQLARRAADEANVKTDRAYRIAQFTAGLVAVSSLVSAVISWVSST